MQNKRINSKSDAAGSSFINRFCESVKKSKYLIIVFVSTFFAASIVTLADFGTREAALQTLYTKYEIGQIAEENLIADRTILPKTEGGIQVHKGERLAKRGFAVTEESYKKLMILAETPGKLNYAAFWRSILYLVIIFFIAVLLIISNGKKRSLKIREAVFLSIIFVLVYCASALLVNVPLFSSPFMLCAIIPATLCVMLITILISFDVGVYFSLLLSLAVLGATSFNIIPALFVYITCLFSVRLVHKMKKRIDFMQVSFCLFFFNALVLFVLSLIFNRIGYYVLVCCLCVAFNGFISGILVIGFLTPLESALNTVTAFRLMDLADSNNSPIMQHMLVNASGTYNHSMMVANLAENACQKIEANSLLARVGAIYHDIGKLEQPEYFVENQTDKNKHDDINPSLSASVIKRHVKKGVEKARQLHLPQEVIDIIAEHHGNGLIAYFYNEAKKIDPSASPEDYSYDGNLPSSKESAVVMLADTVEAACRTLEKPSVPRLEKFIRDLVMDKYEKRLLDNANLTFLELAKIQEVFVNTLAGYYHSRIKYPDQKDPDQVPDSKNDNEEKEEKSEKNDKA